MKEFDTEAHLTLRTEYGEHRIDRKNSQLYTHLGDLAMFDHVFITITANGEECGSYIFRHNPAFDQIATYMAANDFPMHLNSPDVSMCDQKAFDSSMEHESSDDFIPEEWESGTAS